jgi:preprotein translocase subunit SecE
MRRILDFLTEVRLELTKVVWPTPQTTIRLTAIVILVTIIVGFFIGGVDYILTKLIELVLKK